MATMDWNPTPSQQAALASTNKAMLVSAAAGSGKTRVLTERIIQSLVDKEHPADLSRMLVVTFTKAAATELKNRISAALNKELSKPDAPLELSKQLLLLGSAQISTIDSFFQKQIRENFEQLEIPSNFRIADSSELLRLSNEILDELIEEFYHRFDVSKQENSFVRNRENRFAAAIDHLISHRSDGKLNGTLLNFYEKFSKYTEGIELLRKSAEQLRQDAEKPFFESSYGNAILETMKERMTGSLMFLKSIEQEMSGLSDCYARCVGLLSADRDYCKAFLKALEEKDYARVVIAIDAFPSDKFPTVKPKPDVATCYHEWRKSFKKETEEKIKPLFADTEEEIKHQMLQTAELCGMLYLLFSEYQSRFLKEKKAHGILEHDDVRAMLHRLLTLPDGKPSPFALSLSDQYDAVYIDEYQDVDSMQDTIFRLIGQNKRFMVGDIKQSIYGFRGSEPLIFSNYRRTMPLYSSPEAQDADGISVFMSDNFRCNKPIIDFANRVCSFLFSACEKSVGYRPQDDLVPSKAPIDGVTPHPVRLAVFDAPQKAGKDADGDEEDAPKQEVLWTVREISRLLRTECRDDGKAIQPSDVAILVRTAKQAKGYVDGLRAYGIPVSDGSAANLLFSPLMTDLLNLLRTVDNPYRDLPLSEFLISELGGFTLTEVGQIRSCAPEEKSLFDAMTVMASEANGDLSKKAMETVKWIQRLQDVAAVEAADRFLHQLYLEERILPYAEEEELLYLYEQARTYQRTAWGGLYGFLNYFSAFLEKGESPNSGFHGAENAVKVMTIHKSKGLEFPVVFLCSTGGQFTLKDLQSPLFYHKEVGFAARLYDAQSGNMKNTAPVSALKLLTEQDLKEENIRTLYVALTRAKERLYVTGTLKGKLDTAMTNAKRVRRGNRYAILKGYSYLSWILAAYFEKSPQAGEFPCIFHNISNSEEILPLAWSPLDDRSTEAAKGNDGGTEATQAALFAKHCAAVLEASKQSAYPLSYLRGLPTKAAASRLSEDLLDVLTDETADKEKALRAQAELMKSSPASFESLLSMRHTPSAADIGTATHAVLELCDFDRLQKEGVEAECNRLITDGFLGKETVSIVNKRMLEAFLESNLFDMIKNAKRIYREQKFGIFIPMGELTKKQELAEHLSSHPLFVQGSIDLLLETEDGRLYLVDYKTDHVTEAERKNEKALAKRMTEKHKHQLLCYARAVKELFGKEPDEIFVYSVPLGRALATKPLLNL